MLCKFVTRCYSDVNVEISYSPSIATDLVLLLIKYKNDGFLGVAELGDQYCLLLK